MLTDDQRKILNEMIEETDNEINNGIIELRKLDNYQVYLCELNFWAIIKNYILDFKKRKEGVKSDMVSSLINDLHKINMARDEETELRRNINNNIKNNIDGFCKNCGHGIKKYGDTRANSQNIGKFWHMGHRKKCWQGAIGGGGSEKHAKDRSCFCSNPELDIDKLIPWKKA